MGNRFDLNFFLPFGSNKVQFTKLGCICHHYLEWITHLRSILEIQGFNSEIVRKG